MGKEEQTSSWLAQLLDDHGGALVLYARQWCDCPEDVVQEALLELVSQPRMPTHVVAWLYRVVRNEAISVARKHRRREQREQQVATSEAWFSPNQGPLESQEAAEALADLPIELREVIVARIWGNLTFAEIAEIMGTSLSTAQRRYEQGIQALQTRLEKPCTTNDRREKTN